MPPPEKPLPKPPKPKPPKPKPKKLKTGPSASDTKPMPERDVSPINGGVPSLPHPFSATSCSTYPLCPPPPSPPATVHLRSARLPTPLIAVSASLLALSAVLLLALLIRWLVRRCLRGQQQQHAQQDQEAPLAPDDGDDESVLGVDTTAWGAEEGEEVDSGDVHHVWFIRTKGLDERAIAAIAAVVYDASSKGKSRGGGAGEDGDGCAVCLAEFRDGETLRLLPRCGHAFHRGCIDTWLRAHVNCPLCRAPVQVHVTDKAGATAAWVHSQAVAEAANHRGAPTDSEEAERVVAAERAVRRAASMVTIPRRAWPDVAVQVPPASSSAREEGMTGLAKIRRLLKLSDALVGVGRSMSFGAGTCQRLPTTRSSGPSTAAAGGVYGGDEIESSR